MSDDPDDLPHTLLPLDVAAGLVFSKVYQGQAITSSEEALDSIATTMAVLAPIYEYHVDSRKPARRLSHLELEGGMFKGGARELRFIDGRRPRRSLAVAADEVSNAIEVLRNAAL